MKGYFIIDGDDFGVGSVQIEEEDGKMSIRISGNDDAFDLLTGLTDCEAFAEGEWKDLLCPPELYFEGFEAEDGALSIDLNEDMLDRYSFGLLLEDSCLLQGHLRVEKDHVTFRGQAEHRGKMLEVSVDAVDGQIYTV